MTNAELIKALRWCQTHGCSKCVALLESGSCKYGGDIKIFEAAADALEAADKRIADCVAAIDALDDSNDAYIKENERLKKRIAELETQMPKEGECKKLLRNQWINYYECSICGNRFDDAVNYCPNCGARMDGAE